MCKITIEKLLHLKQSSDVCAHVYVKKLSILILVLMVMKVFFHAKLLGFPSFSSFFPPQIYRRAVCISCLDGICVSMCFLYGSVVMAAAEES